MKFILKTLVILVLVAVSVFLYFFLYGACLAMGMGGFSYLAALIPEIFICYYFYWQFTAAQIKCPNCNQNNRVDKKAVWFQCINCKHEYNLKDKA